MGPDNRPRRELRIFIDGVSLLDLVRNFESGLDLLADRPELAGDYLWPRPTRSLRKTLLMRPPHDDPEGETLLDCICDCDGCWPLLVRVVVDTDLVIWCDFHNPHIGWELDEAARTHASFGPYFFRRTQYAAVVGSVKWSR